MEEQGAVPAAEEQEPIEPVENAEPTPAENGEPAPPEGNAEGEERPPKGRDAESRIKELVWKGKNKDEQIDYWREQYERVTQARQEVQQTPAQQEPENNLPAAPVPPDRFDYDSDEDYSKAVSTYQQKNAQWVSEILTQREQAAAAKQQETHRQAVFNERQQTLKTKMDAGREKYADFEAVAFNPTVPLTSAMTETIIDADNSADIAYHLGTNPQEAARISNLSPMQQVMEIAKLDVTMASKQTKITKAPPPSEPVSSGDAGAVIDPDRLPIEEWRRLRNEGKI